MTEQQTCGHPVECIVSSDEGTNYCAACEQHWWCFQCEGEVECPLEVSCDETDERRDFDDTKKPDGRE